MPIEKKPRAVQGAGDISKLSDVQDTYNLNLGDWQKLGDVAASVVVDLSARREAWLISRCRISPSVARVVAVELFGGVQ